MIHERLRLAREQKGSSVEELARRAGLRPVHRVDRPRPLAELPAGLYGRSSIRSYPPLRWASTRTKRSRRSRRCSHAPRIPGRPGPALRARPEGGRADAEPPSLQATAAPAAPIAVAGPSRPLERDAIADIVIAEASPWQRWPAPAAPAPTCQAAPATGCARSRRRPSMAQSWRSSAVPWSGSPPGLAAPAFLGAPTGRSGNGGGLRPDRGALLRVVRRHRQRHARRRPHAPGRAAIGRMVLNPREVFGRARRSAFRDGFLVTD